MSPATQRKIEPVERRGDLLALARKHVEPALERALDRIGEALASDGPPGSHVVPERLLEAMRYAVLSPGKRARPALVLGAAKAVGGRIDAALPAACAVEMIHAYSLVHDDLPALDDDDLRRGLPACHRRFDEATALLAGDALLTEALALVADERPLRGKEKLAPARRARATAELARAVGAGGMVGGQLDDIDVDASTSLEMLRTIHRRKTGRLIQVSVAIGAIVGGGTKAEVDTLRRFGADIGLAFQLVDDLLDGDGVVPHVGAETARDEAIALTSDAIARLERFGARAKPLGDVANAMAERVR